MRELKNLSNLHISVYNILKEIYPHEIIKDNYPIKIDGKSLYIDLFIPRFNLGIECDGKQHYEFTKFFHADAAMFHQQKSNDKAKQDFCEMNKISLVRVKYNDKIDREFIQNKIIEALRKK